VQATKPHPWLISAIGGISIEIATIGLAFEIEPFNRRLSLFLAWPFVILRPFFPKRPDQILPSTESIIVPLIFGAIVYILGFYIFWSWVKKRYR
jgi:hypothetical protein